MNATQSIPELQHYMAAGRLSAESLVRQYLKRIWALNQRGPAHSTRSGARMGREVRCMAYRCC
jgi:Asp-tRNA(Asn)/Glu-tRNA(Gln) amidotransferase A subunit family amidase